MEVKQQHIYLLDEGSVQTWLSADNDRNAIKVFQEWNSPDYPDGPEGVEWTIKQLNDDELLTVTNDDGVAVTKTCSEWAQKEPCCLIACTEY